jgi:hypothetical protein
MLDALPTSSIDSVSAYSAKQNSRTLSVRRSGSHDTHANVGEPTTQHPVLQSVKSARHTACPARDLCVSVLRHLGRRNPELPTGCGDLWRTVLPVSLDERYVFITLAKLNVKLPWGHRVLSTTGRALPTM